VEDVEPHESPVFPDQDFPDEATAEVVDDGPADGATDGDAASEVADIPGPEAYPGGFVGKACNGEADCKVGGVDGDCLNWVKGYCSVMDCGSGGVTCPEGSVCMGMTAKQTACAVACDGDADCRVAEAYACKALLDSAGLTVHACWQVKKQGGPAEGCDGPQDCAGAATCLTNFSGGYCAVQFCAGDAGCPEGTHCVKQNKVPTCLKACEAKTDCVVPGDLPRECIKLNSIDTGDKVGVCGSGTLGVQIGQQCLNDSECTSFDCHVVATGSCSATPFGCLVDNDCPETEVCVPSPGATYGYCTLACSAPCTGQNYCVGGAAMGKGECLPGCSAKGDAACRAEAGLSCIYGAPIGYPQGHYACARIGIGALGGACASVGDCTSGQCLSAAGGKGYCTGPCTLGYCPFPTSCQKVDGQDRCLLMCLSGDDCPAGQACSIRGESMIPLCYPT
jgi:hypothetical protein